MLRKFKLKPTNVRTNQTVHIVYQSIRSPNIRYPNVENPTTMRQNLEVSRESRSRDIVTETRGSHTGKKRQVMPNTFWSNISGNILGLGMNTFERSPNVGRALTGQRSKLRWKRVVMQELTRFLSHVGGAWDLTELLLRFILHLPSVHIETEYPAWVKLLQR